MSRSRIILSVGALLIACALVIGLVPVHGTLTVGATENGPGGHPSISCGSPLLKKHATYSAPFTGLKLEGDDPCSVARDHRRLPVKVLGGLGVLALAAGVADGLLARRRRRPATPVGSA